MHIFGNKVNKVKIFLIDQILHQFIESLMMIRNEKCLIKQKIHLLANREHQYTKGKDFDNSLKTSLEFWTYLFVLHFFAHQYF